MEGWAPAGDTSQLIWSESISRAIRHVLNVKGSCHTYGSLYSDYVMEALQKHYAFHVQNLRLLEVTASELILWTNDVESSAVFALDYILSQDNIDNSIFVTTENLYFGMGCACASEQVDADADSEASWTCIFAVANQIVETDIKENIPVYQTLDNESCSSKCPLTLRDQFYTETCKSDILLNINMFVNEDGWCAYC